MAPPFLGSALDGGEWSSSLPGRFTPPKEPQYPLGRRLGGPQNQYECYGDEKNLASVGNRKPTVQSVALRYTD
jgi:hypothetical protein